MKTTILIASLLAVVATAGFADEHRSGNTHGSGHNYPGRYDNTRIRAPKLVQKREESRVAITKWVPKPGYEFVDERNPSRPPKGEWVKTGSYYVTYFEIYDDNSTRRYTVIE